MKHLLLVFLLGSGPLFSQQESTDALQEHVLQKTIETLKGQSKAVLSTNFDNIKEISADRKQKLEQLKTYIVSNTDLLINKLGSKQDITSELDIYNDQKTLNATEYFVNYKTNLKLIQSIFGPGSASAPWSDSGSRNSSATPQKYLEGKLIQVASNKSLSKIYDTLTQEIYKALMEDLNSSNPGSWSESNFILTFGSSDALRQYINKRCADIAKLDAATEENLQNIGGYLSSSSGVIEDQYLMLTGQDPTGPLAKRESQVSELAFISSKYLVGSFLFGLETIKHNQLLYAPPVAVETGSTATTTSTIVPGSLSVAASNSLQQSVSTTIELSDNASTGGNDPIFYTQNSSNNSTPYTISTTAADLANKPSSITEAKIDFKKKYDPTTIQKKISELEGKQDADYFSPYMELLSTTESVVYDFANESMKLSQVGQDEASSIAKEAKNVSTGIELVAGVASFIPTLGIGAVGMGTLIGIGVLDEVKMVGQEIDREVPATQILKNHALSMGIYMYMAAARMPGVAPLLKQPFLRLSISSLFAVDLGHSLIKLNDQRQLVADELAAGQITQAMADLKKLDLLRSTISTTAFFAHTIGGLPAEVKTAGDIVIKQAILPAVEKYVDPIINSLQPQKLVLMQTVDGKTIAVNEKAKIVLNEFAKNVDKSSSTNNDVNTAVINVEVRAKESGLKEEFNAYKEMTDQELYDALEKYKNLWVVKNDGPQTVSELVNSERDMYNVWANKVGTIGTPDGNYKNSSPATKNDILGSAYKFKDNSSVALILTELFKRKYPNNSVHNSAVNSFYDLIKGFDDLKVTPEKKKKIEVITAFLEHTKATEGKARFAKKGEIFEYEGTTYNVGAMCHIWRNAKKGQTNYKITKYEIEELNKLGFAWSVPVVKGSLTVPEVVVEPTPNLADVVEQKQKNYKREVADDVAEEDLSPYEKGTVDKEEGVSLDEMEPGDDAIINQNVDDDINPAILDDKSVYKDGDDTSYEDETGYENYDFGEGDINKMMAEKAAAHARKQKKATQNMQQLAAPLDQEQRAAINAAQAVRVKESKNKPIAQVKSINAEFSNLTKCIINDGLNPNVISSIKKDASLVDLAKILFKVNDKPAEKADLIKALNQLVKTDGARGFDAKLRKLLANL